MPQHHPLCLTMPRDENHRIPCASAAAETVPDFMKLVLLLAEQL